MVPVAVPVAGTMRYVISDTWVCVPFVHDIVLVCVFDIVCVSVSIQPATPIPLVVPVIVVVCVVPT